MQEIKNIDKNIVPLCQTIPIYDLYCTRFFALITGCHAAAHRFASRKAWLHKVFGPGVHQSLRDRRLQIRWRSIKNFHSSSSWPCANASINLSDLKKLVVMSDAPIILYARRAFLSGWRRVHCWMIFVYFYTQRSQQKVANKREYIPIGFWYHKVTKVCCNSCFGSIASIICTVWPEKNRRLL